MEECFKRIVSYGSKGTREGVGHARGAGLDDLKQMVVITDKLKKLFCEELEKYTKEYIAGALKKLLNMNLMK